MDLIGLINHESAELARMVEDLLVSARVEANALVYKMEAVDLRVEMEAVTASMQHSGPVVDVLITHNSCWGDPVRIRQILRNLLSNAHRYGGPRIRMTTAIRDGMLELSVADDGPGVTADMEPRLFTRFVHGGREPLMLGSVGLGLSVVASMAEDMGGSAFYEYRNGWARFAVLLPLEDPIAVLASLDEPFQDEHATHAAYLAMWRDKSRNVRMPVPPADDV
jgi:two-component system OmpR family sensor kinase